MYESFLGTQIIDKQKPLDTCHRSILKVAVIDFPNNNRFCLFYIIKFFNHLQIQDIVKVDAPVACRKSRGGYKMMALDVLDPFGLVHYLWDVVGIDIPIADVQQYWRHHRAVGCPWAVHSQAPEDTMPLGLYGDSVKVRSTYQGLEKMIGVFLNVPLFRPRTVRCSRWLLFAMQEELLHKHHTLDCIYRYLTWALNQLYTGKYPTCGPKGEPLTEKAATKAGTWICQKQWRFQVTELRGDWSWHRQVFRFKGSWKSGVNAPVCFKCRAFGVGQPQNLYYNIEENSPIWNTEYSLLEWIVEQLPASPCSLD